MRRLSEALVLFTAAAAALSLAGTALAAAPAESDGASSALLAQVGGSGLTDIVLVATWTFVGVLLGGLLLGALYFFKREMGGFPENPAWVAPISIERSETFPDEGDFGDAVPDAHGSHH